MQIHQIKNTSLATKNHPKNLTSTTPLTSHLFLTPRFLDDDVLAQKEQSYAIFLHIYEYMATWYQSPPPPHLGPKVGSFGKRASMWGRWRVTLGPCPGHPGFVGGCRLGLGEGRGSLARPSPNPNRHPKKPRAAGAEAHHHKGGASAPLSCFRSQWDFW